MKLSITEVRDLVAEVVRETVSEARKKKELPPRSEESIKAQRDRQVRATGYSHEDAWDFSRPMGDANVVKKQGASGMGGWTKGADPRPPAYGRPSVGVTAESQLRHLIRMIVAEELAAGEIEEMELPSSMAATTTRNKDPRRGSFPEYQRAPNQGGGDIPVRLPRRPDEPATPGMRFSRRGFRED